MQIPRLSIFALASLVLLGGAPGTWADTDLALAGPVFSGTSGAAYVSLDKVCLHTDAGWVDATAQAGNSVPFDVPMSKNNGVGTHAAMIGHLAVFDELRIQVGLAGSGGALIWKYWDGNSFELVQLDAPANLDTEGYSTVSFALPTDWALNTSWNDCDQDYYYLKVTTESPYDVIPIADQMWTP